MTEVFYMLLQEQGSGTDTDEESAHNVNSGEENCPPAPAGIQTHNLLIMSLALLPTSYSSLNYWWTLHAKDMTLVEFIDPVFAHMQVITGDSDICHISCQQYVWHLSECYSALCFLILNTTNSTACQEVCPARWCKTAVS